MKYLMKILAGFVLLGFLFQGCYKDDFVPASGDGPVIEISKNFEKISGINVGDEITIPVSLRSENGIKRLAWFFIRRTANGTESGQATYRDPENFPTTLQEDIVFTVDSSMTELVIVSFDRNNRSSEVHITMDEIRGLPVISFENGIDFQETIFENKNFIVRGNVSSEFDLESLTYKTIRNNEVSAPTAIEIANNRNSPFAATVNVQQGLTDIIITATNIYNGMVTDTFRIGNVAEDAVSISLANSNTSIPVLYMDSVNQISGNILSGSAVSALTYAIKTNGVYGPEIPLEIGTPADEFPFAIDLEPEQGMEAVRLSSANAGGKTAVAEFQIDNIWSRLLHFRDIRLTTEVGPGKHNWFSAWLAPHVFDVQGAAANQMMMDFAFIQYGTTLRFAPAALFEADANYANRMAPYMTGFTKATYTLVTSNRGSITPASFNALTWDGDLDAFIDNKIKAPSSEGGENYNVHGTNRRVSAAPSPGTGFIIGWGVWDPIDNQEFGLVLVKELIPRGNFFDVVIDVKVPAENMREKYNPVSTFDYN